MDKIGDVIAGVLAGYLKSKSIRKKKPKKVVEPEDKKTSGVLVSQVVNVGHPEPMNEADMALGRMRKQPNWSLLK